MEGAGDRSTVALEAGQVDNSLLATDKSSITPRREEGEEQGILRQGKAPSSLVEELVPTARLKGSSSLSQLGEEEPTLFKEEPPSTNFHLEAPSALREEEPTILQAFQTTFPLQVIPINTLQLQGANSTLLAE